MESRPKTDWSKFFSDKTRIQKIVAEQYKKLDLVLDPALTAEKLQAMMLASGIRPEDNIGSCGIIAARESIEVSPGQLS